MNNHITRSRTQPRWNWPNLQLQSVAALLTFLLLWAAHPLQAASPDDERPDKRRLVESDLFLWPGYQTEFQACVGERQARTFLISNEGNAATILSIDLLGDANDVFAYTQGSIRNGTQMAARSELRYPYEGSVIIEFRPREEGEYQARLRINYMTGSDAGQAVVPLTGQACRLGDWRWPNWCCFRMGAAWA